MVETSHDNLIWEQDATYSYYKHGPLARTVLGQQKVQGIDYAYTLQGWLKGVNSTSVNDGAYDMGGDGKIGGTNSLVARDAYGFSLNYFSTVVNSITKNDYKAINSTVSPFTANVFNLTNTDAATVARPLFNGNIASMMVNIPKLGAAGLYGYSYDQLQRLMAVDVFKGLNNTNNTFTPVALNDYKERLTYSANGNIQTYQRNGTGLTMNLNNYTYSYTSGTNKLASISNSVNAQTKTYSYDAIGNTTADGMQGATNIVWNVYGKVQSLTNAQGQSVSYTYDAGGNRISKTVSGVTEWYVRDASGNNMATYTKNTAINSGNLTVTEWYKYGSSLLSINTMPVNVEQPVTNEITTMERGYDGYILTDHLGNTRAVVTDRKLQHSSNGVFVDYYVADVKSATYYSSYGATAKQYNQQPIVAFNGQRKSNEIGNDAQTALYWEYNGDVGRRWNVDPKPNISISPYNAFSGNPIWFSDVKGDTAITGRPIGRNFDNYDKSRTDGYQSKKDIGGGQYLVVDNKGDRYITYEKKELKAYHNNLESWQTTLYYWSERPQKKGEAYAEGAHWVEYKDDIGERAQGMIDLVNKTGMAVFGIAAVGAALPAAVYAAPTIVNGGNIFSGSLRYGVQEYGRGFVLNTAKQYFSNGGDVSKMDWFDIGVSSLNPFRKYGAASSFMNEGLNSLVDYKNGGFKVALFNKSASDVIVDFSIGQVKAMGKTTFSTLNGANEGRDFLWDVGIGLYKNEAKKAIAGQ